MAGGGRTYRDDAVVVRTRVFGEADRVVTLLTRTCGRVECLARGVRRTRSKFGARLEPFMNVDVQLHVGKTFHYVNQVQTLGAYGPLISADYDSYTAASAVAEATERMLRHDDEPNTPLYHLALGAFAALAGRRYPPRLVVDAYLLRAVAIGGWAASFTDCAVCGLPGPHPDFSVQHGGSVCSMCRAAGSVAVSPEALAVMGALVTGDWPTALAADRSTRRSVSGLVAAYAQWHLETGIRSLPMAGRSA